MPSLKKIKDSITDQKEKTSSPTKRAGITVKRVCNMLNKNVKPRVIIAQLNENSQTGNKYTIEHLNGFKAVFIDSITRVGVSKSAETALIKDQSDCDSKGD